MKEIRSFIDRTIQTEERFLVKFPEGISQHSLLRNRIRALQTARELISGERIPSREELEFALPRVESILSKTRKARDKYEPGSRNYLRFDPTVRITEQIRDILCVSMDRLPEAHKERHPSLGEFREGCSCICHAISRKRPFPGCFPVI